jgi:hypothetical protein
MRTQLRDLLTTAMRQPPSEQPAPVWWMYFIVVGVGILTFFGRVSGDAFVFVIGTLLGYIFAFLSKYLGLTAGE